MTRSTVWVAAVLVLAGLGAGLWVLVGGAGPSGPAIPGEEETSSGGDGAVDQPGLAAHKVAAPAAVTATLDGHIRGSVLDTKGKPVAGVRVTARRTGPVHDANDSSTWGTKSPADAFKKLLEGIDAPSTTVPKSDAESKSDAAGAYDLSVTTSGNYDLRAWPEPPRQGGSGSAQIDASNPERTVVLRVADGHPLHGRVLGAGDAPVAAVVSAWILIEGGEASAEGAAVATNPQTGDFEWLALADGKGSLTVKLAGRSNFSVSLKTPQEGVLIVRVPGGGTIHGKVSDSQGAPVASADVVIGTSVSGSDGARGGTARGKSGGDGTYRLEGVPAGKLQQVQAMAAGFLARTTTPPGALWVGTELKEGQDVVVDIVLQHGGTVTGRVVEPGGGVPVADAIVTLLLPQNRWGEKAPSVVVDKEGRFRMEDVPLGRYVVFGQSPSHYMPALATSTNQMTWTEDGMVGGTPPPLVVVSKDGETITRDVEMKPGLAIKGRVTGPGGTPVAGAKISSNNYGLGQLQWQWGVSWQGGGESMAVTDAEGRFRATGLPPKEAWTLSATKPPLSGMPTPAFQLAAGAPEPDIAMTMEAGATVVGRIVADDGTPLPGKDLSWYCQDGSRQGWGSATSGAEGAFRLEGVAPATVTVQSWKSGGGNASVTVEGLKAGEVREGVELKFLAVAKITGVVVDAEGKPVPGRYVLAHSQRGNMSRSRTNDDGTFEFTDTTQGTWNLGMDANSADENGSWSQQGETQAVQAPATGVRIVATPRKSTIVAGRVVLPDGSPVPLCTLKMAGGNRGYDPYGASANEVVGGEFRRDFAASPPFDVTVSSVRGSTGASLNVRPKTVSVTEATNELVITLETGGEVAGRVMDPSNGGVEGVTLTVGSATGMSDATGAFRLSGLGTGDVSISVRPPPRFMSQPPVKAQVGATDVVVRVSPGLAISGRILGMEDVPGLQVQVQAQGGTSNPSTQAAADGTFRLEGFAQDAVVTLYVNAWSQSRDRSFRPLNLKNVRAGTEGVQLRLEAGVTLSGIVVDADGKPAANVWLQCTGADGNGIGAEMAMDGAFTLRGLTPGTVEISVHGQNDGRALASGLKFEAPGKDARIVLPRMQKFTGRLLGSDTKGFYVGLSPLGPSGSRGQSMGGQTQPDGTFSIDVPGDGPFRLTAQRAADDRYGLVESVRVGAEVSVRLDVGLAIEGTLEDAAGKPSGENSWVMFSNDKWSGNGKVGGDGTFRARGLPPGRYKVAFSAGGSYERWADEVDAGTAGLRLKVGQNPAK